MEPKKRSHVSHKMGEYPLFFKHDVLEELRRIVAWRRLETTPPRPSPAQQGRDGEGSTGVAST